MEEAAASDSPGQVPPMPDMEEAEASDNHGQVPPRPANWDQKARLAKKYRKQRQKRKQKQQ
eukprot:CAMPEP_0172600050 /NCGR_PEP_ID=MMETSP1068-20121228/20187_1 /TAXON_ID=35684 /ORGANISM="Pseudopedinella elastica, Strain CCMP716" /LENGTH=60 /DNA_ID=CAMNT_0013400535 /DNA_START=295 /DNA_END=477 /DNA_ORIENTATION=-